MTRRDNPKPTTTWHALRGATKLRYLVCMLVVGSFSVAACTAEPPRSRVQPEEHRGAPVGPVNCAEQPQIPAPTITFIPTSTNQTLQPIRGVAPGAGTISARSGGGDAAPAFVSGDGNFCIEAPLIPNQPTSVTLTPISKDGCPGQEKTITLNHSSTGADPVQPTEGTTPAPPPTAPAASGNVNLAVGSPVDAAWKPDEGIELRYVVDGDPHTSVPLSFIDRDIPNPFGGAQPHGACNRGVWIRINLTKLSIVNGFKLHWGPNAGPKCAVCYTLLLSAALVPGEPAVDSPDWVIAESRSGEACINQEISIQPVQAQWAAVILYEDNQRGIWETFDVGEIEVLGRDPNVYVPIDSQDRCP